MSKSSLHAEACAFPTGKSAKAGEIATLLTIGAVIFLGISTLVSSTFLKDQQTTSSKASTGVCRDNPEAPPAGYTWKADCAKSCSSNADCPKNTSSGYVDANSSNWCYGFESGFRCLQLQYGGGGGSTDSQPGGTTSSPSGSGTNNGCFTLAAEFEPKKEGDKWAFYAWVRFSGSQTGDVQLMYNGTHVAGWNRKPGADDFVYDPSWTQPYAPGTYVAVATMSPGQSITASYQGFLSGCTPQDITVSCTLSANALGATVSGTGCVCRGCSSGSTPLSGVPPVNVPTTSTSNPTVLTPTPTVSTSNVCTYNGSCSIGIPTCGGTCYGFYCCKAGQVTPTPTPLSGATSTPVPPTPTPAAVKSPTPIPTKKPSLTTGGEVIPTPTSTPVPPTSFTELPEIDRVVNMRGAITVLIPFENPQYLKYFTTQNFSTAVSGVVKKTRYCPWYSSCTQSPTVSYSSGGLSVTFKDLGRYVNDNGLKQAPYTVNVSFLGESYYNDENIVFDNYETTNVTITSPKKINLANFLKVLEISFDTTGESQNVYQDTFTMYSFDPYISFYEMDGSLHSYPSDGQLRVDKSKTFKLIYSYFDYYSLPNSVSFVLQYACGNASTSSVITVPIKFNLKENSVETVQPIGVWCGEGPGG